MIKKFRPLEWFKPSNITRTFNPDELNIDENQQKQQRIDYLWSVLRAHVQSRIWERNMNKLRKKITTIQAKGMEKEYEKCINKNL